jgi:hypothetical protein
MGDWFAGYPDIERNERSAGILTAFFCCAKKPWGKRLKEGVHFVQPSELIALI